MPSKRSSLSIDEIKEAVQQGIVASKQTDSQFWGEQIKTNQRIEKILTEHLEDHKNQQAEYRQFYGRVEPILKKYDDFQSTARTLSPISKGIGKGVIFFGSILGAFEVIKIWFKKYF